MKLAARTRVLVLVWAGALFAAAGLAALPAAAAQSDAETMILTAANEVLDAIRADKAVQAGNFERLEKLVDERIMPHVDFDKMTRLCVGRAWRGATPEQRSALVAQFRMLLMRTYSGAVSKVTDHKVRLRPSHGQEGATDLIVRTEVVPSQGEAISLDYRMEKLAEGWKIYDINILGVWLVENYKNEFNSTLNQSGIDGLIQTLTQKNETLAHGAKKP